MSRLEVPQKIQEEEMAQVTVAVKSRWETEKKMKRHQKFLEHEW